MQPIYCKHRAQTWIPAPSKVFYLEMGRLENRVEVSKKLAYSRAPWLSPVILATLEAEIRRISSSKPALGK
jgi:hypothetical protein